MENHVEEMMERRISAFTSQVKNFIEYYDSNERFHNRCCNRSINAYNLEEKLEKYFSLESFGANRSSPFVIQSRIREISREILLLTMFPKVVSLAPCYYRCVGLNIADRMEKEVHTAQKSLVYFLLIKV